MRRVRRMIWVRGMGWVPWRAVVIQFRGKRRITVFPVTLPVRFKPFVGILRSGTIGFGLT